jgi:hypothetical protein
MLIFIRFLSNICERGEYNKFHIYLKYTTIDDNFIEYFPVKLLIPNLKLQEIFSVF